MPVGVVGALLLVTAAVASTPLRPISSDPYGNPSSAHRTQVEPSAFGWGDKVVAAFQSGRFFDGGSTSVGASATNDAGLWWSKKWPRFTTAEGGPYTRASDPSVAYDASHDVWLVEALGMQESHGAAIILSRSTNGGNTWQAPVTVSSASSTPDKNWITCDNWPSSPHYGHCYAEWDDNGLGNLVQMSTSSDGGLTWSDPASSADGAAGLGGVPLAQPNGVVVVPYSRNFGAIKAFRSTDGGLTWSNSFIVSSQDVHAPAGGLRALPIPTAEIDASGKIYVAWFDCRFRSGCASNDIVMSTSINGLTWSPVQRIPIDVVSSTGDHFLPGLGVDRTTAGGSAKLGLGYYYYPVSNCSFTSCQLKFGFVGSSDGGASWSPPTTLAGPMSLGWLPDTTQGRMVGDFMSSPFTGGMAHPVFADARAPNGSVLDEHMASAGIDVGALTGGRTIKVAKDRVRVGKYRAGSTGRALPGDPPNVFPNSN